MNNQDVFVVKGILSLRALPSWLKMRSYNLVRHGLQDKRANALIGLMDTVGTFKNKTGLICIWKGKESLIPSLVKICEEVQGGGCRTVDAKADTAGPKDYDLRKDFLSLLAENETLMPEHAAFAVTCTQMGMDEEDGYDLLHDVTPQAEAIVTRRTA